MHEKPTSQDHFIKKYDEIDLFFMKNILFEQVYIIFTPHRLSIRSHNSFICITLHQMNKTANLPRIPASKYVLFNKIGMFYHIHFHNHGGKRIIAGYWGMILPGLLSQSIFT